MRRDTKGDQRYRPYITRSFDRWVRLYDPFLALFRLKGVRRATVEMSEAQPGDRVLDVCTGTGDLALEFARRCDEYCLVDILSKTPAEGRCGRMVAGAGACPDRPEPRQALEM
ncbi:MAG: hypothetical protein DRI80_15375 [Chloroflexota bacterium]|nr:MAG: hypothetical protein DRI80_15375 [Chloroflexota bacterium]